MRIIHSLRQSYLITLGAWLAAFLVALGAGVWVDRTAFALWLGAIWVGAFFEGRKGGMIATGLAVLCLLGQYQLIPADSLKPGGVDFLLSLALLTGTGVLAAYLSGECRDAVRTATLGEEDLQKLRRRLADQEQVAETLRQNQREHESRSTERIATLDKARSDLQEQLEAERAAGEVLRRDHAHRQDIWAKAEESLQQRLAQLTGAHELLQKQLAEHHATSEALRREHAHHQDAWNKVEETQQQRLMELSRSHEFLQGQLTERRGVEEALRRDQAASLEAWQRTEDSLHRQIDALTNAHRDLQNQLAERQTGMEDLQRQLAEHAEARKQMEDDLRRQLDALTIDRQQLQQQLGEREAAAEILSQEMSALAAAKAQMDQEAAALRQRETELGLELKRADADRLRAAEEMRRLETERCAREEALQEQAGLLHGDRRVAEDLLECVTDRLRSLLARIREAAGIVKFESAEDPSVRAVVEELDPRVRRGLMLLDAVRTAQQIRRGDLPIRKVRIEAHAVIDQALETCGAFLRQHVTVALPLGPEWLVGDPDLLSQAVAVLLDHAANATESEGDIRLTVERQADTILFGVEDDGRGIAAEDLLDLARRLVEGHGGRFRASSRTPERGRILAFHMPACPPPGMTEIEGAALKLIPFHPELRELAVIRE